MAALEQELKKDRSPSKLLSVNEFGLVILTRKRVRQSLERTLCQTCPYCTGSGMIKSVATVCAEIYEEVKKLLPDVGGQRLVLRVNPDVARALAAPSPGAVRRGPDVTGPGELEAYVLAIERHFRTWRGTDHALSPRDFALARSWHEAGVPLAHVLVGIDRAFESDAQASSLAFCRRRVEELVEHLGEAKAAGPESVPLRAVEEALQRLEERLLELSQEAKGVFSLVLPHLRELRDLVAVSARPNWDYLRRKLLEIDLAVTEAAPQALDPEGAKVIEAEARRAVERHQGRVDAGSLENAALRLTRARARERLLLPRVNLL
jgi:hypothetical protein